MAGDAWDAMTWEGARRAQLEAQAAATPAVRLRWLEEALIFVAAAKKSAARAKKDLQTAPSDGGNP